MVPVAIRPSINAISWGISALAIPNFSNSSKLPVTKALYFLFAKPKGVCKNANSKPLTAGVKNLKNNLLPGMVDASTSKAFAVPVKDFVSVASSPANLAILSFVTQIPIPSSLSSIFLKILFLYCSLNKGKYFFKSLGSTPSSIRSLAALAYIIWWPIEVRAAASPAAIEIVLCLANAFVFNSCKPLVSLYAICVPRLPYLFTKSPWAIKLSLLRFIAYLPV